MRFDRTILVLCWITLAASPRGDAAIVATITRPDIFDDNPDIIFPSRDVIVGWNPGFSFGLPEVIEKDIDIDGDGVPEVRFIGPTNGLAVTIYDHVQILGAELPPPFVDDDGLAIPLFTGNLLDATAPDPPEKFGFGGFPPPQWFDESFPGFFELSSGTGTDPQTTGGLFALQPEPTFLAVRFLKDGNWHYGWIQVDQFLTGSIGAIGGWAWETEPDTGIIVGVIPEPSVLVMAVGSIGLCLVRRRSASRAEGQ